VSDAILRAVYFWQKVFTSTSGNGIFTGHLSSSLRSPPRNAAQIVSSCLGGGQKPRMEFAFCLFANANDGKIENYDSYSLGGGRAEKLWLGAFSAAMAQKLICCRFQWGFFRLWFRFQSNLWALQVQVNMCDKRPYEARTFFFPKLLNKNVFLLVYFSVYWNLSGAELSWDDNEAVDGDWHRMWCL